MAIFFLAVCVVCVFPALGLSQDTPPSDRAPQAHADHQMDAESHADHQPHADHQMDAEPHAGHQMDAEPSPTLDAEHHAMRLDACRYGHE